MQLKRRSVSKYYIFLSWLLIALGVSSCKPIRQSSRIIVAGAGKITSLDPAQASTFHAIQLISALGDPLYRINKEGDLIPKLALREPQISSDGLSILIQLRQGILFHDGTDFNAEAMAFSIRRFMKIGTINYILNKRISSVEVLNPYLIKINLNQKSSSINGLLSSINLTPVSPKAYSRHKDKFLNTTFIGTGPYRITSFSSHIKKLQPYKKYWEGGIKNNGIDFISLSNSTSLFSALRTQEIDLLLSSSLDEDQKKYLTKMAKKGLLMKGKSNPLEIGFISLNTNLEPLNKPLIRKALSMAIDRPLISNRVSYGSRNPLRSIVPPSLTEKAFSPWPSYNPRKAKELMKNEGYCNGKKMILQLTFRSNVPADKLFALIWQEQINRDFPECMKLTLNGIESTTIYKQLSQGTFQAVILDWRGAYPDPEAYLTPLLSCKRIINYSCKEGEAVSSGSFWASKKLDITLKKSEEAYGSNRLERLKEVEEIAAESNPYIPIWLVTPQAWGQSYLSEPKFDGSGYLLLQKLKRTE